MKDTKYNLLENINFPSDLRKLKEVELPQVCKELRQFIIDTVSTHPGHLGASLGTVEMTVALHYVFNTPYDKLVWDVGHQAYSHKILTGRKGVFHTNRMYKGISGFPKISESEYDAFGVGHASTSISSALGMAVASKLKGDNDRRHIAVIGDGSISAGMAFEGLNQTGVSNTNLLVVLNDNNIAIDQSVGALKEYLTDIVTSHTYNKLKDKIWKFLGGEKDYGYHIRSMIQRTEHIIKLTLLKQSNLFEALKFRYLGPVDGHDVIHLVKVLKEIKRFPGPKLLHCVTVKGKGFLQAEKEKTKFHAPGLFNKDTGEIIKQSDDKDKPLKYQEVFGRTIIELARQNDKIIGITPAMATGSSLNLMMAEMPDRVFDVGIAEQHAVTFSAGLATQGFIPFCNIYSSFMQRAYDQVIHDVALQKLHVVFCLDRGGLVGEDGATHHGFFDIAYMRCVPNMIVAAPMNEEELRNMMYTAQLDEISCPFSIRYPRGNGMMKNWETPFKKLEIGKGRKIKDGEDIAILTIGSVGNHVIKVCEILEEKGINAAHYDLRFVRPIDGDLLRQIFKKFKKIITVEDGTIVGGMGSAVIEFMNDNLHEADAEVKRLGIHDYFVEQGKQSELYKECGYDVDGIVKTVKEMLNYQRL